MFETVLVANRGEIAVRVMRACEELGVGTVAVYSDADRHAGHVRYADEAYNVGPARAADSYLDGEAIVDAAVRAGADAVHPGYGFLAENADFAARVEGTDGLTWIGPTSDAMERLGEKTSARSLMREADVPIVPGTTDPVEDPEEVVAFGEEHGFPVAIKAEGGGGGRGMKIVREPDEAADKFESARREGEAYFSNPSVYLERYLTGPRHVEVQVLADRHGEVRHLGERDCSLQRRHQKVVEEAPSPALTDELRAEIGDAARRGAEAAGYRNAGTFEFLVAERDREPGDLLGTEDDFYFLEVNTRIQVEHPVSEAVTGIDIVKWQIRVAAGEELAFEQDDVSVDGHAMEFRINAENAADDFAPATGGSLDRYDPPGGIGVRVDDALRQGDDLVTDYDSLVAKLITHGEDRAECLARGRRALADYDIEGIPTVVPFHRLMLDDDRFVAGTHTTDYLDEHLDRSRIAAAQERWGTGGGAADLETGASGDEPPDAVVEREFTVEVNGKRFEVSLEERGAAVPDADGGGAGDPARSGSTGGSGAGADATGSDGGAGGTPSDGGAGAGGGATDNGTGADGEADASPGPGGEEVVADMQGTILDVAVAEGDRVAPGDVLCVLEAMKMENDVVAERGGTVTSVGVAEGDSVNAGETLFVLE